MNNYSFILSAFLLIFSVHVSSAQKAEVYITITQNCSNCNVIKSVYEEISKNYTVKLLFEERLKPKEIDAYFTEIIKLPKNTAYIQSDSLWEKLGRYAGGSYLYIVKENKVLYACNIKYYQSERINMVLNPNSQEKKIFNLPDSINLIHFSDALLSHSNYILLNTNLNKIYLFELNSFKCQKTLSENSFDLAQIWRAIHKDTIGIYFAKKVLQQYQKKIPDQKMLKIEQIDSAQDTLLIWGSVLTPKVQENTEQPTVTMERTDILLWYKDKIHRIEPFILPDSLKDCYLVSGQGSIIYEYPHICIPINISPKSSLKKYMYAHFTLQKNNLPAYNGFYPLQRPQQNKMNFMNSFKINNNCLFFNAFPYYYDIKTKEIHHIDFLNMQNLSPNMLLQSWFIHYASIDNKTQEFCMIIKLTDNKRYFITIDNYGIVKEKILLDLPFSIPSDIVFHKRNMIYISEDKEKIILHKIP